MDKKITKSDDEWRQLLTPSQYQICRQQATEPAFTGEYNDNKVDGVYVCVCCGAELFDSTTKFDSGSGWPSFTQPIDRDVVEDEEDNSAGVRRTETHCARCDSHLGHVFPDGPQPTGLRYCINSLSLTHKPRS